MLDIILGTGVVVSLGLGGYGIVIALKAQKAIAEGETILRVIVDGQELLDHKVKDLQTILTAAPPDMINASIMAGEWKRAMESLPEGSPRRQAFAERLKQLGSS
jgi:hypothetical protein